MIFSSFTFLLEFFPVFLVGCFVLRRLKYPKYFIYWVIAGSLLFYSFTGFDNLLILCSIILLNFILINYISDYKKHILLSRLNIFILSIGLNIACLVYFKYYGDLPIGMSFYLITQIIFIINCYQGSSEKPTFINYLLFISYFPTVLMGPILDSNNYFKKVANLGSEQYPVDRIPNAILLMGIGLFKKIVVADSFMQIAEAGYSSVNYLSSAEAWITSCSYFLQIYYDFSGYSDMACAISLLVGINILNNFNSPLQSRNLIQFWSRWHISLTNFITHYLYTPLLMSVRKINTTNVSIASIFVMTLVGVWHGSTFNYFIFGMLHGVGIACNHIMKKFKIKLPKIIAKVVLLMYVNITFIFFYNTSINTATEMVSKLFTGSISIDNLIFILGGFKITLLLVPVLIGLIAIFSPINSSYIQNMMKPSRYNLRMAVCCWLICILYLNSNSAKEFIYFRF